MKVVLALAARLLVPGAEMLSTLTLLAARCWACRSGQGRSAGVLHRVGQHLLHPHRHAALRIGAAIRQRGRRRALQVDLGEATVSDALEVPELPGLRSDRRWCCCSCRRSRRSHPPAPTAGTRAHRAAGVGDRAATAARRQRAAGAGGGGIGRRRNLHPAGSVLRNPARRRRRIGAVVDGEGHRRRPIRQDRPRRDRLAEPGGLRRRAADRQVIVPSSASSLSTSSSKENAPPLSACRPP